MITDMPLAEAILYAEKIPRENGIRRFRFLDERAFVKFVSSLSVVRSPAFRVETGSRRFYIVHGSDEYGEVVAFYSNGGSNFIESSFKMMGIAIKSCGGEYLLDLLKL